MTQTPSQNRLTVLLANEQEGWHQTVRGLLEPQGVQTLSARSGREALNLIESQPDARGRPRSADAPARRTAGDPADARDDRRAPAAILLANRPDQSSAARGPGHARVQRPEPSRWISMCCSTRWREC